MVSRRVSRPVLAYGMVDYYIEAEYLYDLDVKEDSYAYAWTELGDQPPDVACAFGSSASARASITAIAISRARIRAVPARRAKLGLYVFILAIVLIGSRSSRSRRSSSQASVPIYRTTEMTSSGLCIGAGFRF